MNFSDLVKKIGELPYFGTSFLAAGESLSQIRLQLSRWVRDGKVVRLHKGLYVLAEPYRKVKPEPFAIANALKSPSYVSLQSAPRFAIAAYANVFLSSDIKTRSTFPGLKSGVLTASVKLKPSRIWLNIFFESLSLRHNANKPSVFTPCCRHSKYSLPVHVDSAT